MPSAKSGCTDALTAAPPAAASRMSYAAVARTPGKICFEVKALAPTAGLERNTAVAAPVAVGGTARMVTAAAVGALTKRNRRPRHITSDIRTLHDPAHEG